MSNQQTGTVKWFNESKGFGFIAPDNGGADLFAHFGDIQTTGFKTLTENQRVSLNVQLAQKATKPATFVLCNILSPHHLSAGY
jgi:CspA family cold shock protein